MIFIAVIADLCLWISMRRRHDFELVYHGILHTSSRFNQKHVAEGLASKEDLVFGVSSIEKSSWMLNRVPTLSSLSIDSFQDSKRRIAS